MVADLNQAPTGSFGVLNTSPSDFFDLGGTFIFNAQNGKDGLNNSAELYTSDGTAEGTKIIQDGVEINHNPSHPGYFKLGDIAVFSTRYNGVGSGGETELWRTDGTADGTYLLADLNGTFTQGQFSPNPASSAPDNFVVLGDERFSGEDTTLALATGEMRADGGAGDDRITGNRVDNQITGAGGKDNLAGGTGNDYDSSRSGRYRSLSDRPYPSQEN